MTKVNPEERVVMAEEYFRRGYNCSQSVALAFKDFIGIDETKIAAMTGGFGGGMGRLREVCGAFSGCVLMAGELSPADNPDNKEAKAANYALVQKFAERFKSENGGSIICRELLGLERPGGGAAEAFHSAAEAGSAVDSPVPSDRTPEYYRKRPCVQIVGAAARIIAEEINSRCND